MAGRTGAMLDKGFAGWGYIRPEFVDDLHFFRARDPQFFADLQALMTRAQSGTCRRKIEGDGVLDDGDWDSPMASSRLDIGELRMPENDLGWMIRTYVASCVRTPGLMVALLVGDKASSGAGRISETQNGQVREAEVRLLRWEHSALP